MLNKSSLPHLIEAETKAAALFEAVQQRQLIQPGKTEKELNSEIFELAFELFGIRQYWHKRIVRAGRNTLLPYAANPENLALQADDILFFDFGPVFEQWEADFGRTYVIGNDARKLKLATDVALAWQQGKAFYEMHKATLTGADFYQYTKALALQYGWHYGNIHCGHLVGNFPHETIVGDEEIHYIHPDNHTLMSATDQHGNTRHWIYEIHFIDETAGIGGFFEQLLG